MVEKTNQVEVDKEKEDNALKIAQNSKDTLPESPVTETESSKTTKTNIIEKEERAGIVYIFSSQNNTFIHITDMAGNTLSRVSGGMITKHSRLKADPTIAMFAAKRAAARVKDLGITALYIRTRAKTNSPGIGPGAHAAIKSLSKEGFRIISILDTTRVPRGGPKKKGGKRGRRV